MLLDWFFPYAAGVANCMADEAQFVIVTRDHGHELGSDDDAVAAKRAVLDCRVRMLTISGRQRDLSALVDTRSALSALRDFRPDVLHVQDHVDWRLYLLQQIMHAVPTLLTIHDVIRHEGEAPRVDASLPLRRHIARAVRSHAEEYVVHGRSLAGLLESQDWYGGQAVNVIPHGRLPYLASSSPLPPNPTVLFFGRLESYKGLDILIEAAEIAADSIPGLKVIIAGRGPAADRCRALVTTPGLFDWRLGFVPNAETAALFAEASVVALPYRDASQSGVVPLAFVNGRPVIATNVGAISEAVRDGHNGILIHQVSPAAVAAGICRVFNEDRLLSRLADGALETVTSGAMSQQRVAELHMRAYSRLGRRATIERQRSAARSTAIG